MAVYAYTGVDEKGRQVRGTVDADSVKSARQSLRKKGIFLDDAKPLAEGSKSAAVAAKAAAANALDTGALSEQFANFLQLATRAAKAVQRAASSPTQSVSLATRQLATLLKAGIPLPEALAALIDQVDNEALREAWVRIAERVREGIPFAKTLEEHPQFFAPLYVHMVAAGEASGTLEAVLERLAEFTEGQVKLKNKLTGALAYPAFMAVFGVIIIGLMMVVVVPKVSAIFEDFRRSLPWYTEILITTSRFVGEYWWLMLLTAIGGAIAFNRWRRTPEGAYKWDAIVLRLPIFGELARMVAISRFSRTLSTLLASGVPLLRAMDIVKNVLGNRVLEGVITEATTSIREGESIAEPLKRSKKFPPMVTHMIAIGERSGELEGMLGAIANSYDSSVDARLTLMTSLLEPVLIAVMGGGAGLIAFAILMPMLQLGEFVQ